jgi:hypothetical protein
MKNLYDSIKKIASSFILAMSAVRLWIAEGKNLAKLVTISEGNIKTGKIASFSTLPFITCHKRCINTCGQKCYAKKICLLRKSVMTSYAKNTAIAKLSMHSVFIAINEAVQNARYFRYHVSGDIIDYRYFLYMVKTARKNEHCQFLCFTKQYEIVNKWIERHGKLPENLKVMFSGWTNLKPVNPYNLPETTVYEKDNDFNPSWKACGGNC